MDLDSDIKSLKNVGETTAKQFAKLGIFKIGDLIDYYPRRYEDFSNISKVNQLKPGVVSIRVIIKQSVGHYVRRGIHITEAVASDDTGSVRLLWFNQPYRKNSLKTGHEYFVSGNFELSRQRFAIMNPSVELVTDFPLNTARILPIYGETKGLSSRQIRAAQKQAIDLSENVADTLPPWLIKRNNLLSLSKSLRIIHFPPDNQSLIKAQRRLAFEEVFRLILASLLNKQEILNEYASTVFFDEKIAREFVKNLPFKLTNKQRKVIWQIYLDMQKSHPMNRLVEGDVGSGKTVVAAMAAVMVIKNDFQVAVMAPTEILARQHAQTLSKLLKPLGLDNYVGLLVGSMNVAQKTKAYNAITEGRMNLIVGTHSLIQDKVNMKKLGLIVVDEQHRFGVEQRKKLIAKAGHMPHALYLTATPIPRSLALTLYGELDVSILDEKPIGRIPVVTEIISPNSRAQLYSRICKELDLGHQMFVVCPLITDSGSQNVKSVENVFSQLSTVDFKQYRLGLLHGQLKSFQKTKIMEDFIDHKLDILVSTSIIEVGVDIPNASVMLIESAERFGLAQIHQLRGRIGRGKTIGYCFLMTSDSKQPSARLRAIERYDDGFKLADLDLELRGPGAIYGTLQHGRLDLRMAKLSDTKMINQARVAAQEFIDLHENIAKYPDLDQHVKKLRALTNLD